MDPQDQTFMTIHNLTADANILFASESILDILGYQPEEVVNKSCFDYFHPDEVPLARSVHSRGVRLDKAAVLHYARIRSKDGRWVSCECCFTVVHDVLVASTSIYSRGAKSEGRAMTAPRVRRLFSSSPRDPRYHMLEHLSPKFKMAPTEREPRAALVLNRFTRNLTIMFATNAVSTILGLRPDELLERPFYHCIQENCLADAIACLESAKKNESIAYLRFFFRDPRQDDVGQGIAGEDEDGSDEDDFDSSDDNSDRDGGDEIHDDSRMDIDGEPPRDAKSCQGSNPRGARNASVQLPTPPASNGTTTPAINQRGNGLELEAVVSCTSDGLVVVLRKARPPIPDPQLPLMPAFNYENGLFAAPWGLQPIEPYYPPELLYTFRAPFLPQFMPLQEHIKAAGGPPRDQLMRSIRDVAVFAWAVVGINGNLANFGQGLPGRGAQPHEGLPIWDPSAPRTEYEGPENRALGTGLGLARDDDLGSVRPLSSISPCVLDRTAHPLTHPLRDSTIERRQRSLDISARRGLGQPDGYEPGQYGTGNRSNLHGPRRYNSSRLINCDCPSRHSYHDLGSSQPHTRGCASLSPIRPSTSPGENYYLSRNTP